MPSIHAIHPCPWTTGSTAQSSSVMMRNVTGLHKRAERKPNTSGSPREAKFPNSFSLPVGFVPPHPFLSLSPCCGGRGRGRGWLTRGTDAARGERRPQPGCQATGREDQRRAQQQQPPTTGLAGILETHVCWRERKKAAEYPHNCCLPAGERNQSTRLERLRQGTGLHTTACAAQEGQLCHPNCAPSVQVAARRV